MTPFYADPRATLWQGDCREVMAAMPAGSVHCVVTSPPYLGLRAYAGEQERVWGGDPECGHEWGGPKIGRLGATQGATVQRVDRTYTLDEAGVSRGAFCPCGAWRGALGLEPTIALYIAHMVEVMRGVRRVLRDDGLLFLNIGDSYSGAPKGNHTPNGLQSKSYGVGVDAPMKRGATFEVGEKNLMLIPERLAIALQDDGWICRSRIAWAKLSAMPESVTDRPSSAWEHIWLFAKQGRYFWDAEAVKQKAIHEGRVVRAYAAGAKNGTGATDVNDRGTAAGFTMHDTIVEGANLRNFWLLGPEPQGGWKVPTRVSVSSDDADDGTERITSPDCPIHGDRRVAKVLHGGPQPARPNRIPHNGNGPVQGLLVGGVPIAGQSSEAEGLVLSSDPAATPHSTPSSRTGLRAATTPPYTASEGMSARTGDTPPQLAFGSPHPGTGASNIEGDSALDAPVPDREGRTSARMNDRESQPAGPPPLGSDSDRETASHRTESRTGNAPGDPSAGIQTGTIRTSSCTCSYYKVILQEVAHFAQFPTEIPRRAILAGTSAHGCCGACGAPWRRVVERETVQKERQGGRRWLASTEGIVLGRATEPNGGLSRESYLRGETTGWHPTCAHEAQVVPATVFDPFAGSGTTLMVARALGRIGLGAELSEEYCRMAVKRIQGQTPAMEMAL